MLQAAGAGVAGVSASVGTLVSSINSVNTAFLTQSSAFIGSPANPQPDQQGGGVWARGVGGHVTYGTTATAGNISYGGPLSGTITCNTRTLEDFAGVQIGADFAKLNVNGWNLHAGSTIGYLGSTTQDATPPGLNPLATFGDCLTCFRIDAMHLSTRKAGNRLINIAGPSDSSSSGAKLCTRKPIFGQRKMNGGIHPASSPSSQPALRNVNGTVAPPHGKGKQGRS